MPELTSARALTPGPRRGSVLALCLVALATAGCGARRGPPVTRVLHGERVPGAFVSPYSYEHYLRAEMASARGDFTGAAREFAAARLGGEDDVFLASREAESLEASGDHARADAVLREAERLDPSSEAVWLTRGRILEARGDDSGAAESYAQAASWAPQSARAALELARVELKMDATAQARATLTAFLTRAPQATGALRVRLRLALASGAIDEALTIASALRPVGLSRAELRALVAHALNVDRPVTAARLAERLDGADDAVLRLRALLAAGRRSEARDLLQSVSPEALGGPLPWARWMILLEDPELAADAAEEALAVAGAHRELAGAQLRAGRLDAALDTLDPLLLDSAEGLAPALQRGGLRALASELGAEPLEVSTAP